MPVEVLTNPFPGLRPFEPDEDHLFFGRERETDELLRRLRTNRFLAVVGTSGSGKSSLVRSGLIPSLHSGFMVSAGSGWRVSIMRPGEDPFGHLAAALDAPDALGIDDDELSGTNQVLIEATLRRGTLGLVEAVKQARISPHENVLVVVDQFEELFRYRRTRQLAGAPDDAVGFVKLLLEAGAQTRVPVYIVLTMRSDFIGDCMEYPGLPEAVNAGLYLVPRMTRDELRAAITGPVAVAGAEIAHRLVLHLLNEVGDDPYRLPVLQHALMRTFDRWQQGSAADRPIDLADFEAIGTLRSALSIHAEEAYAEIPGARGRTIAERVFKALTDTFSDPRGTRRPTTLAELAAVGEASEAEVVAVLDLFRRPGRSFLTPPAEVALESRSIVDLAHESLMRGWARLIGWAEEERQSAEVYARLSQAAAWWREGKSGLWRNPELELGLRWRRETRPGAAWARRYGDSYPLAMEFLDRSQQEHVRVEAEREASRRRALRQARLAAAVLGVLLVLALLSSWVARRENARAEQNLALAREAVDEALSSASADPARTGVDVPELVAFRRELLRKAGRFYAEFVRQSPDNEELLVSVADAHRRLGHIHRLLDAPDDAEREYRRAIERYEELMRDEPNEPAHQRALADTYNWLGETLRPLVARSTDAARAYDAALRLQQALYEAYPTNPMYRRELARTHYNRGILLASEATSARAPAFAHAETAFREAIALLAPMAETGSDRPAAQELARAMNNLATLIADFDESRWSEAQQLYHRAVTIHEKLAAAEPGNREIAIELATFDNNLAFLMLNRQLIEPSLQQNRRALAVLEGLARPAPSVGIEQADSHNLRGRILQQRGSPEALAQYRESYQLYEALERTEHVGHPPKLPQRFGDLVINLAYYVRQSDREDGGRRLLRQAIESYFQLGREIVETGSQSEAEAVDVYLSDIWASLDDQIRQELGSAYRQLRQRLEARAAARTSPASAAAPAGDPAGRTP